MGWEISLFSLKGLLTLRSTSHTIIRHLKEIRKMPQLQETQILKGISSLSTERKGSLQALCKVLCKAPSCHVWLCTFSTGKHWYVNFKDEAGLLKGAKSKSNMSSEWFRSSYHGLNLYFLLFLSLLRDRVADTPRKWLGRHLPGHGKITWGCTTVGSGGFCFFLAALPWTVLQFSLPWFRNGHPMWQCTGCCSW